MCDNLEYKKQFQMAVIVKDVFVFPKNEPLSWLCKRDYSAETIQESCLLLNDLISIPFSRHNLVQ